MPSVPIDPGTGMPKPGGVREPICRDCVEVVNPERVRNGLDPIRVHPDAYEPQECE